MNTEPIALPIAKRGRRTPAQQAEYEVQLSRFYDAIREIQSRLILPRRQLRERFAAVIGTETAP